MPSRPAGESGTVDEGSGASGLGVRNLRAHGGGSAGAHHRAERGLGLEGIPQAQPVRLLHEALDEGIVDFGVHVDTLDGAARLPGIVERSVGQQSDGVLEVGVGAHVRRVLSAQLEACADEALPRRPLHGPAPGHGAREGDEGDAGIPHHARDVVMAQVQVLEHTLRQMGGGEGLGEPLGAEGCLGRVLEDNGVAGHECRHDGIHRREIRVVPRGDHEDDPQRLPADEAAKSLLGPRLHVPQRLVGRGGHIAGALLEAADLAGGVDDGPPHLPSDLRGDVVLRSHEGVDGVAEHPGPLLQRGRLPPRLLSLGRRQSPLDLLC